jgi:hypothetical protein
MNTRHASHLAVGTRIRRKDSVDRTCYVVERIELKRGDRKKDVIIHAGGHTFRAWEIERAYPVQGWPKEPVL